MNSSDALIDQAKSNKNRKRRQSHTRLRKVPISIRNGKHELSATLFDLPCSISADYGQFFIAYFLLLFNCNVCVFLSGFSQLPDYEPIILLAFHFFFCFVALHRLRRTSVN